MLKGIISGLRAVEREDLPKLLEWRNSPEYRRYFREYRELGMSQQSNWFESTVLNDERTLMFTIVELASQQLLGACGLCHIDWINRNAEVSIYIGANRLYIDENFAPDVALTMTCYAFYELGMNRLWSEVYDFDNRKKCFFENLGFMLEGRHRQTHWADGKWHDSLFYGLLAFEFDAKQRNRLSYV